MVDKALRKLILASISLGVSVLMLASVSFAWFVSSGSVNDMNFQILQIDSQINLYYGNDFNNNGVVDLLDEDKFGMYRENIDDKYSSYSRAYYNEIHDFTFVDSKYALSLDTEANSLNSVTLNNVTPGKVFTFKYEITNYSNFENNLTFSFIKKDLVESEVDLLNKFSIRIGSVNKDGEVTYLIPWSKIVDEEDGNIVYKGKTLLEDIILPPGGNKQEDGRLDLWTQIRFDNDVTSIDETYKNFSFPDLQIDLVTELEEE